VGSARLALRRAGAQKGTGIVHLDQGQAMSTGDGVITTQNGKL